MIVLQADAWPASRVAAEHHQAVRAEDECNGRGIGRGVGGEVGGAAGTDRAAAGVVDRDDPAVGATRSAACGYTAGV